MERVAFLKSYIKFTVIQAVRNKTATAQETEDAKWTGPRLVTNKLARPGTAMIQSEDKLIKRLFFLLRDLYRGAPITESC
jgi:hypothetical protein